MISLYNEILFRPILNLLVWIYGILPFQDMGVAIIIVTIIIRFLLFPLAQKSIKSQKALQELQPKINAIKNKHKDKQEQTKKVMEFYKENKINPFGSCLPLLLQLPIIFALYQVFRVGMSTENLDKLYAFVAQPETINSMFLGIVDLTQANVYLAVLAGFFQFIQSKMISPKTGSKSKKGGGSLTDMSSMLTKQMVYFMPVMTVFIGLSLPAGLTLYWVTATIFAIGQQYLLTAGKNKQEKNA